MVPIKAVISNKDKPGDRIQCLFNPNEYTIAKSNSWQPKALTGRNVPKLDFTGGGSRSLTMELFFDTYEQPNKNDKDQTKSGDVRAYINQLWKLTMVDESLENTQTQRGRPPLVVFEWGPSWSFTAAITSLSVRYTLFRQDGTPVRAVANVTFQEAEDEKFQPGTNPTSQALPGYKLREVRPNETLAWIAYEEYGDAGEWRRIADENHMDNPLGLRPGQVLAIPPR